MHTHTTPTMLLSRVPQSIKKDTIAEGGCKMLFFCLASKVNVKEERTSRTEKWKQTDDFQLGRLKRKGKPYCLPSVWSSLPHYSWRERLRVTTWTTESINSGGETTWARVRWEKRLLKEGMVSFECVCGKMEWDKRKVEGSSKCQQDDTLVILHQGPHPH